MGNVKSLIEEDELFFDSAIVSQGYAPFMRDYYIVVDRPAQVPDASKSYIEGRYRYRFTHCPEVSIQSRVTDDAWQHSWEDIFTDYQAWETAGAPSGFVWGVCWADAYPGLSYVNDSPLAASWTRRLGREMHEVCVESNAFVVRLVCHDLRVNKIAQGDPVTRELTPLDPEQGLQRRYNIPAMPEAARRIPLDRRVCIVREGRIDLRPERGAVVLPLIGLAVGLALFAAVALFADSLSTTLLAIMLIAGLLLAPLSAMGVIYSIIGAAVVVERQKQSVRFQQGVLGLGLGTVELVPFWKIERIEVDDFALGDAPSHLPRPAFDLRAWDIVLVKTSGKRLPIGQVVSANREDLIDEGFNRSLDAAEAIGAMTEKPVVITAAVEDEESKQPGAQPDETPPVDAPR